MFPNFIKTIISLEKEAVLNCLSIEDYLVTLGTADE